MASIQLAFISHFVIRISTTKHFETLPMPSISFDGKTIECDSGQTLRKALIVAGTSPHNGQSTWLNCKGLGSCGTCAVKVTGVTHDKTIMEKWRLSFPPHKNSSGLRLACQVIVTNDLVVEKQNGFWGQKVAAPQSESNKSA